MAKKIIDEFTDLPISRARKYQLRKLKLGLCPQCGHVLATKNHCLKCAVKYHDYQREYRGSQRRNDCITTRLRKKGGRR